MALTGCCRENGWGEKACRLPAENDGHRPWAGVGVDVRDGPTRLEMAFAHQAFARYAVADRAAANPAVTVDTTPGVRATQPMRRRTGTDVLLPLGVRN